MSKITIVEGNSNDKDNVRVVMVKGERGLQGDLNHNDIVDNLTSSATDKVLSAKQGKILNESIGEINDDIAEINGDIAGINETLEDKANTSDVSSTYATKTEVNTNVANLNSQISGLASGSPLVASSTAGMTDTSRVYVNTTDGKWYYYNGSAWVIGGTYQGTELSENVASYNNLTSVIKDTNLIKELTLSDLVWLQGYNRYLGNLISSASHTSSQCFKLSKGSSITCNDLNLQVRYTFWNIDGTYLDNTGTYRNIPSYNITADCYASISYDGTYDTNTIANFSVTPIKNNFNLNFSSYAGYHAFFESEIIWLQKGDIIKTTDIGKYRQNGTLADPIAFIGINKYGIDKITHEYKNMGQTSNYSSNAIVIEEDSFYRIYLRTIGAKNLADDDIPKVKNLFEIIKHDDYQYNFLQTDYYRIYISSNGKSEIIEQNGPLLYRLINPANEIIIKKGNETLINITFNDLLNLFTNKQIVYNEHTYLKLEAYETLYYDTLSNSFKITNLNGNTIGNQNIMLLVNAWGNILNCALLILYLKNMSGAENIFNSADYILSTPWVIKSREFSNLLNTTSKNIETYTFFTDPHLMGFGSEDYSTNLQKYVGTLQKVYNSTPMNYIVCGGDWLNSGDTPANACFKLGYIDGFMNSMFHDYYPLVGNHDTNYQGTEQLSQIAIDNLWYRTNKKAYFKFNGKNSINYCLDTGIDSDNTMTSYRWEQVNWLAEQLLSDDPIHSTIYMHIVWRNDVVQNLANNITLLINAFNNKSSITLNNNTYNFTNVTGHVDYIMCGHIHSDKNDVINNILCIATTTFAYNQSQPNFDMVINDYENNKVRLIRYGSGSNREFDI